MRTLLPLAIAASILSTGAFASTATVNAGDARKPIAENIYNGYGDEMHQAQLAATYSIDLPVGELARVALLGTFGQQSVAGIFSETPMPPPQGAAIALFTDYDGQGSRFGNTAFAGTSTNPNISVFPSFDLDGKVTVVLVNKSANAADAVVLGFQGIGQKGDWRAFEMTADGRLNAAGTGTLYDAVLTRTVQPYTALLVEYRPVGGILPIRTEPAAEVTAPAAEVFEAPAAPAAQPMGCSAVDVGVLSVSLLALLGVMRRRSVS